MKILFLGAIAPGQTSQMRMRALQRLGHTVLGVDTVAPWHRVGWLRRQLERKALHGPVISSVNRQVLEAARKFRPALIWAEKQEYLRAGTLVDLKRLGCSLVHFTPDPYFSLPWKRTPIMDQALFHFDGLIYCKAYERVAYEDLDKPLAYMPLGYSDEVHRPMPIKSAKWLCAVGFLGGWEPRRERMLHDVASLGVDLKIWGYAWDFLRDGKWSVRRHIILKQLAGDEAVRVHQDPLLAAAHQGGEVYLDDYARALSGARIGLGFLRTICPDQHTTRTFEIPASGSMLLADRTEEHQVFFEEGKEADFFSSREELVDKVAYYLRNEARRASIASRGLERCRNSGYAYLHRMDRALQTIRAALP